MIWFDSPFVPIRKHKPDDVIKQLAKLSLQLNNLKAL